jgi:hypothetical protein
MSLDGSIHSVLLDFQRNSSLTGVQMIPRMGLIHFFFCDRVAPALGSASALVALKMLTRSWAIT